MSEVEEKTRFGLDSALVSPPTRQFLSTTVLTRAIALPSPRQTRFLLEQRGCNPNQKVGARQMTPLMVACFISDKQRRLMIFKILLEHGADPMLTDVYGRNSTMYASAMCLKREVELLIKNSDYDLNAVDMYGDTMLHVSAKTGDVKVLGVILREMQRYRKSINIQNDSYLTPLSLAIMNGHSESAKMLHSAGGQPRFSPPVFSHILSMISKHHKELREAGVRAIADASSVGQAFYAKGYFLKSAEELKCRPPSKVHFTPRSREGDNFLPEIETNISGSGSIPICPVNSDAKTFKFPQLSVCRERKYYYY